MVTDEWADTVLYLIYIHIFICSESTESSCTASPVSEGDLILEEDGRVQRGRAQTQVSPVKGGVAEFGAGCSSKR